MCINLPSIRLIQMVEKGVTTHIMKFSSVSFIQGVLSTTEGFNHPNPQILYPVILTLQ